MALREPRLPLPSQVEAVLAALKKYLPNLQMEMKWMVRLSPNALRIARSSIRNAPIPTSILSLLKARRELPERLHASSSSTLSKSVLLSAEKLWRLWKHQFFLKEVQSSPAPKPKPCASTTTPISTRACMPTVDQARLEEPADTPISLNLPTVALPMSVVSESRIARVKRRVDKLV